MQKHSQQLSIAIDYFTAQGGRGCQEDRMFIYPLEDSSGNIRAYFVALMDGHGGDETVNAIMEMLPFSMPTFAHALRAGNIPLSEIMCTMCATLHSGTQHFVAGTTLVCAVIDEVLRKVTALNLGDSALLHIRDGKVIKKTTSHNARSNDFDREYLLAKGLRFEDGYLFNGDYGLQCTRSLGDKRIPQTMKSPEIITCTFTAGDTILLVTDGVITTSDDEMYEEEAADIAQLLTEQPDCSAEDITYYGMEIREAYDNATTILLRIE